MKLLTLRWPEGGSRKSETQCRGQSERESRIAFEFQRESKDNRSDLKKGDGEDKVLDSG